MAITLDMDKSSKRNQLRLALTKRASDKRDFMFTLKGDVLRANPIRKSAVHDSDNDSADWYSNLSEKERVQVIGAVLNECRLPSLHRGGWKVASLAISRNPDPNVPVEKRHMGYVGVNSDMRSEELDKECAEQDALGSMTKKNSYDGFHKKGIKSPKRVVPNEIHLRGGREAEPDKGIEEEKIIAPCGKCTDSLAQWMRPEDVVFIYPAEATAELEINDHADTLADVNPNQVWKTTIGHLNRLRHIDLTKENHIALQRKGLDALVEQLLAPLPEVPEKVAQQAYANKKARRESIEELDVATVQGKLKNQAVNAYLHSQIVETLRARMESMGVARTPDAVRAWLMSPAIDNISASVVQYDDGTYVDGLKAITEVDKASSSSQLSALNSAAGVKKNGSMGIVHSWSMNFSVNDVMNDKTTTPSKDGIERHLKKMTGKVDTKPFTHFIFNDGTLGLMAADALARQLNWQAKEILPGGFKGGAGKTVGCGCAH